MKHVKRVTLTETVYLSVGGSTIYAGVTLYTSATGSGTVAAGFYKANNNTSWIRVTSNPPGYVSLNRILLR